MVEAAAQLLHERLEIPPLKYFHQKIAARQQRALGKIQCKFNQMHRSIRVHFSHA